MLIDVAPVTQMSELFFSIGCTPTVAPFFAVQFDPYFLFAFRMLALVAIKKRAVVFKN